MHDTFLEQLTLFPTILSLRAKVVRADLLITNRSDKWTYQVLHALQDFPASQQFLNSICPRVSTGNGSSSSVQIYHWELERAWQFDTTWYLPFQQNYVYLSHTFWCAFGDCSWLVGRQKKKSQACIASLLSLGCFQQSQPCTFLPSPFWS